MSSDRSMWSIGSDERPFRQRMLDAAQAAAGAVLPIFSPMTPLQSLGTFDGADGPVALSADSLSAPLQDAMPLHIPVRQQVMMGTSAGQVFDITGQFDAAPTINPLMQANGRAASAGVAPTQLATTGVTPALPTEVAVAAVATGVTPAHAALNVEVIADVGPPNAAVISASVQDVGQSSQAVISASDDISAELYV